ncbi:MAG TPA: MBL fold metallo-hydrolase [Bellilinea sp.]|nr:MBL fold metallo-hydrolase [Bellilinea sp.]
MDPSEQRQAEIEARRTQLISEYPSLWDKLIQEWSVDSAEDRVWLTYSANYLFRTGGIRWAIDPFTLQARLSTAPVVDTGRDLRSLSFVLLTHRHADHLDRETLRTLRDQPIRWVVPEFMLAAVGEIGIPRQNILVPQVMQEFELEGINILPFEGLHFNLAHDGEMHGVPEMGYRIEVNGQRWLFPGDTRDYNPAAMPDFGHIDTVFAHLWLGRREGVTDQPILLDKFCNFHLGFHPSRIIITHLEELGRNARSYWNLSHFERAAARFKEIQSAMQVDYMLTGQSLLLD